MPRIRIEEKDVGYIDSERRKVVYPFLKKEFTLKPEEEIRLIMVKKLIAEYGYLPQQVDLEMSVKAGQTTLPKKADIIVFNNSTNHDPASQAYIIVEVKKKDRKDGIDQMQTYCNNTTAEFGIWFNGKDIVYQHRKRSPTNLVTSQIFREGVRPSKMWASSTRTSSYLPLN